jgi:hypothetical protein
MEGITDTECIEVNLGMMTIDFNKTANSWQALLGGTNELHVWTAERAKNTIQKKTTTSNLISVNKTPNKRHYLLNQWTFFS